jgi:hypothetical protein
MSERGLGLRDDTRAPDFLTRDQAAEYLGLDPRRLGPAIEPYGIARRYLLAPRPDWYYARRDLDKVKAGLPAEAPARPVAAKPAPEPKAADTAPNTEASGDQAANTAAEPPAGESPGS